MSSSYQPQGGLVYNPPQQQIVTVSSGNPNIQPHYNSVGSRRTGWLQLVCGAICVLLGIVAIFIKCYMSGGYYPIWSGLMFFITPGMAGIWAAKSRTSCAITTFMVLSVFASLFSFCLVWVMLAASLSDMTPYCRGVTSDCGGLYSECNIETVCTYREGHEACVALDVILLLTALVEFIVSIISATICCRGVCCKGSTKSTTTYTTVSQQAPGTVVMAPPATAYAVQPSAPAPYPDQSAYPPAGYPQAQVVGYPPAQVVGYPPADPAYPPEKSGYPEATAPSAPAMDQPPSYEQSVS